MQVENRKNNLLSAQKSNLRTINLGRRTPNTGKQQARRPLASEARFKFTTGKIVDGTQSTFMFCL